MKAIPLYRVQLALAAVMLDLRIGGANSAHLRFAMTRGAL
jgi:hypothetical protein